MQKPKLEQTKKKGKNKMNKDSINQKLSQEAEEGITRLLDSCIKQREYIIAMEALQQCKNTYSKHDEYLKKINEERTK